MAKYLYIGSYTAEGTKGLMKDGGTGREQAARELIESVGGTMEAFYFSFGDDDVYVVADLPDHVSGASVGLTVGASGAFRGRTVVLIEPSEIDEAVREERSLQGAWRLAIASTHGGCATGTPGRARPG